MRPALRYTAVLLGALSCWQLLVYLLQIQPYILPTPISVFVALYEQLPILLSQFYITLTETCLGLVLGVLVGCISGLIIAFVRPIALWLLPLLVVSQAIPTFAIAPLIVIWLGYGLSSKVVVTILMIFFPVTSALHDGLRNTENSLLEMAHVMQSKPWNTLWRLRLPAALPALASGIRIAAVTAPIGAIVGEWVGSSRGLGYFMLNANARMQIDQMFAALVLITSLALVLYILVDRILNKLIWW